MSKSNISRIDPSLYADTGFSLADTPDDLNKHLFDRMMAKTGEERLIIGCSMNDAARKLVWSGIPEGLDESKRRELFFLRFYGSSLPPEFP